MRFIYPAQLERYSQGEFVVSFRDVPWCHTSGEDEAGALSEAEGRPWKRQSQDASTTQSPYLRLAHRSRVSAW